MAKVKLNKNGTITVTFQNLSVGKFMSMVRSFKENNGILAMELFNAVKNACFLNGHGSLWDTVNPTF
jgi:hypothetical protein